MSDETQQPGTDENLGQSSSSNAIGGNQSPQGNSQSTDSQPGSVGEALDGFNIELGATDNPSVSGVPSLENVSRVFDGLDDVEKTIFQQMSNAAYEHLYPKIKSFKEQTAALEKLRKENESIKGSHFFEQDGAWTLSPEYKELNQITTKLNREVEFWEQQNENAIAGNKIRLLLNDGQGGITVSEEIDPTPRNQAIINSAISKGHANLTALRSELHNLETGFKGKHQSFLSSLEAVRSKVIPSNLTDAQKQALTAATAKKLALFPPYIQGRPEVKAFAEALVVIDSQANMIQRLKAAQNTNNISNGISRTAGPVKTQLQTGQPGKSNTVGAAIDEFNKMLGTASAH